MDSDIPLMTKAGGQLQKVYNSRIKQVPTMSAPILKTAVGMPDSVLRLCRYLFIRVTISSVCAT